MLKRISYLLMAGMLLSLAACVEKYDQPHGYYEYDYYNKYGIHSAPNQISQPITQEVTTKKPRHAKPHPYSVTPTDQAKYDSMNNRIKHRKSKVKEGGSSKVEVKKTDADATASVAAKSTEAAAKQDAVAATDAKSDANATSNVSAASSS